jgi:hypothetical protein
MPRVRNIIRNVKVEEALHSRKCHRNNRHIIHAGEKHLALYMGVSRENFCMLCAGQLLERAGEHLAQIRDELGL